MQDMVGGDNNRTPVIFQVPDNLVFVGDTAGTTLIVRKIFQQLIFL